MMMSWSCDETTRSSSMQVDGGVRTGLRMMPLDRHRRFTEDRSQGLSTPRIALQQAEQTHESGLEL